MRRIAGIGQIQVAFRLKSIISSFLLPPIGLILSAAAGLMLGRRWPRLGRAVIAASLLALLLLSTPWFSNVLQRSVETRDPIEPQSLSQAQAIVVLGAGTYYGAPEFGGQDAISRNGLARVRYAAYLHRQSGLPILIAGGAPHGGRTESDAMREVLENEFQVVVRWQEARSHSTAENAQYSGEILAESDVSKIALVTDAIHMPRAKLAFEGAGMTVLPAPTGFSTDSPGLGLNLPSASALNQSAYAIREWLAWSLARLR